MATLARDEATYLQASGSATVGLVLMYQEGSLQHRYRSVEQLPLAHVTEAFQQYLRGDGTWREGIRWEEDAGEDGRLITLWYERLVVF